jgi:cell filamentation protein
MKYDPGFEDPYCYPGTTVLRNVAGIQDQEELEADEAEYTTARLMQLWFKPIGGNFDSQHLRAIHRHLFLAMYEWAGEWRTVPLSKDNSTFCMPEYIEAEVSKLLDGLRRDPSLPTVDTGLFAVTAGKYLGELNAIHPFREGNGRTQREFIRELALRSGLDLRWSWVSQPEMEHASERAQVGDYSELVSLLERGLRPRALPKR